MYLKSINYIIILILLFVVNSFAFNILPYISPGIRIGWDFRNSVTFGPKISLGFAGIAHGFYNITFGGRACFNSAVPNYSYCDLQMGFIPDTMSKRRDQVLFGTGIGIATYNKHIMPHATVFAGSFLFATADFIWDHRVNTDLGLQAVLPIPLIKISIGSPGG
jgi:hypothetical protein